jgi:excisionase family DNA binding protein
MTTEVDPDLLTMAEAAKLLKVSTVTLKRWLKQGLLPAYHVGPRAIRIRRADLAKVLTPVSGEAPGSPPKTLPGAEGAEVSTVKESHPIHTTLPVAPPTEEEVRERLAAMEEAKELRAQMLARRGGKPFSPSWEIIREAREERSRRL